MLELLGIIQLILQKAISKSIFVHQENLWHMKIKDKIKKKTFDAVKFMREQRDLISKDIMNLSPEEVVKYFEDRRKEQSQKKPGA